LVIGIYLYINRIAYIDRRDGSDYVIFKRTGLKINPGGCYDFFTKERRR